MSQGAAFQSTTQVPNHQPLFWGAGASSKTIQGNGASPCLFRRLASIGLQFWPKAKGENQMRVEVYGAGISREVWFRGSRDERQVTVLNCLDRQAHEGLKRKQTFDHTPTPEEDRRLHRRSARADLRVNQKPAKVGHRAGPDTNTRTDFRRKRPKRVVPRRNKRRVEK
jgi:hypothetical protein